MPASPTGGERSLEVEMGFNSICIFYSTVLKEPVLSPGQRSIYIFSRAHCSQNIEFSVEDIKGSQAKSSRGDKSRIA